MKCTFCHQQIKNNGIVLLWKPDADPTEGFTVCQKCWLESCSEFASQEKGIVVKSLDKLLEDPTPCLKLQTKLDANSYIPNTLVREAIESLTCSELPKVPPRYIYIAKGQPLQWKLTLYKIGKSNNPKKRIQQLRLKFGDVELVHTITPGLFYAHTLELVLHRIFARRRLKDTSIGREWFMLTDEDLEWLKSLQYIRAMPAPLEIWARNLNSP